MEKIDTVRQLENINVGEVCRACFETCEQYKMLFEDAENTEKRSLGDVFFEVVKIEMKPDTESSPNRFCLPCSKDLISAYKFIQKSQQNNDRLLEYLKNASLKQTDCLSEFPIDIPHEPNVADFLQIKVENEAISEYAEPLPDDKISPSSSSDSAGSDYDESPLHQQEKINKMQCTYCSRVFKRLDFLENHKRKHEEELRKNDESAEGSSIFLCDECGVSCKTKLELKTHRMTNHTASSNEELKPSMQLETMKTEKIPMKSEISLLKKKEEILIETPNESNELLLPSLTKEEDLHMSAPTESNMSSNEELNTSKEAKEAEMGTENQSSSNKSSRRSKRMPYQKISLEQKELLVKLYEEGKTIKDAASITKINMNTAKCILRNYKGSSDVLVEKRRGGNRPRKLTNEVLSTIETCVEKNPGVHLENIKKILAEQKVYMSRTCIHYGLRTLKITLKLPFYEKDQVNLPQAIEHRRIFALEFANWNLDDRHKMIFIDECVYNLHLGKQQTSSKQKTTPTVLGRSVVVIAALNSNGIIHTSIFSGNACNITKFASFLRELVDKLSAEDDMRDSILIMDNAGIHVSREVGEILATSKYCVRTLPFFSPMLNPLGKSFVKMKAHARSVLSDSSIEETNLVEVMEKSVSAITATDCSNYVMDVILVLHDAIAGRPFQYGD